MPLLALLALLVPPAVAVNFYDGVRAPPGLYWVNYATVYRANTWVSGGGKATTDLGYTRIEDLARFSWYTPHATVCAVLPVGLTDSSAFDASSWGLGDVAVGVGAFLPVAWADVLPMVFVKAPTGAWDETSPVNYGSHQWDVKPMVFAWRSWSRFTLDAALKGAIRFENPDTGTAPGHEVSVQVLAGWRPATGFQVGPSVNGMRSTALEVHGEPTAGSERTSLSAGFDAWAHVRWGSVSVTYLADALVRNGPRGHFFQLKTVWKAI